MAPGLSPASWSRCGRYLRGRLSRRLPALRLGFIVPPDLQEGLVAARAAADQHPPLLDQSVLADFLVEGYFARHLRRMRVGYRERLDALTTAAQRYGGGALRAPATRTGLHAIADLDGQMPYASHVRPIRGVEAMPLSAYFAGRGPSVNGLVLGFAAARPEAARRPWSGWRRPSRPPTVVMGSRESRRGWTRVMIYH